VSIGHNLYLTVLSTLEISKNCTISSYVLITDNQHNYIEIGKHIMNQKFVIKKTFIGENCFIGTGAVIDAGTILGKQCIVGANSVVSGIYPDNCVIVGAPGRIVKRYDANTKEWKKTKVNSDFIS
jgi:acetyltransferase-like isoleucine patch superfamily enzyme